MTSLRTSQPGGDAVEEGERIHREAEEEMLRQEHEDDAVHFRRQFIIRGENYISKLVSHNVLVSKYINIPQEESIIA